MKAMFFAVGAAMLLIGGAAQAETTGHGTAAVAAVQPPAATGHAVQMTNPLWPDNPTALRSTMLRRDGLLINGLLPAPGWQG